MRVEEKPVRETIISWPHTSQKAGGIFHEGQSAGCMAALGGLFEKPRAVSALNMEGTVCQLLCLDQRH